ncbi:serine/threonine-protein kinase [Asanoa iriomotensis]|uniref:non-specific serine/threonine protein kinase n=1 Tax=Asanoa iriomotensis TaxID=234613 RepID=A0ABQ4BXQ6_9ACTN|nr:serine/threonine-protein kinase [Asanoa iriomotensis]GIF55293.1 hypothetical protein Air01nite_13880 [Asanoa iriomotensis]
MVAGALLGGRYELGRFPLAHKGMGEVWPADDTLLDRAVIVKLVDAAAMDLAGVRRFRREALLTARLDHPGVPAVYDLGEHDGRPYVVIEKIAGTDLKDLIAEQSPVPVAWVAAIGAQICGVLVAADHIGLIHRDIKPSNVMLHPSGAVKVLDFGLATMPDDDRYSRITLSGQSVGTLGYMAPEQISGGPADQRTDLYGLGATLYDLLTARPPFDGATTLTMVRHQLSTPPPRPVQFRPDVPDTLDDLVHALLATDPADRPATAAEVYATLAPLARELPPIPGVVDDPTGAVQAYAAIVGRVPAQWRTPAARPAKDDEAEPTAARAERLEADGEHRAAARHWRRLVELRTRRHGADDHRVVEARLRAARAHLPLGEYDRALRLMHAVLDDLIRARGPEAAVVRDLRREIATVSTQRPAGR